ncbi:MAG: LEPR-XLL domain-containing protein, partial [Rhodoferax sp.]|nr:LEPR-XLL domain-containing protein [Rhodoferax sp.]
MKTLHTVRNLFARSSLASYLSEAFRPKPAKTSHLHTRKTNRRLDFSMEAMEPRLLLSADLSAGATWGSSLTLIATDATHVQLSDGTNTTTAALTGDGIINLTRAGGALVQAANGDTVHLNLASLDGLTLGSASSLDIKFTGGSQLVTQDTVQLDGTGVFGYDVKVESDAAIKVDAAASLTATGKDITLAVSETGTAVGAGGYNFGAGATHATVEVLGDLSAKTIT